MPTVAALLLSTALANPAAAQSSGLVTDPNSWRTPEYRAQWGLETIRAADAYARGVDGTGIVIGVVDSGIFAGHSEFIGRYGGGYDYLTETAQPIDRGGHGTGVASVIVANRDGIGMHGVAPGATVIVVGTDDSVGGVNAEYTVRGYNDLIARGVRIINNSWADVAAITDTTRQKIIEGMPADLAAYRRAIASGVLNIWGTANDFRNQPSIEAGLPHYFPELERGWLAVGAVGPGYMPEYSNSCGVAKNWCLVAPGGGPGWEWDATIGDYVWKGIDDGILVAKPGGGYTKTFGTSFATPHVSGAAALVWQMFPFFTADQVRQTLLGTALDIGPPGVDEFFGYGLLDVGKAVLGPGRFDWGDFVVEQPGGVAVFENDIGGTGGLVKRGAGELVLTGNSTYAGATRVEGGFLSVMGSIVSPTSIAPAGTLAGTGVITGNVGNAGAIWAGDQNGIGTLTIKGDYVQEAGGLLVQQVGWDGGQNHLAITGTASLAGRVSLGGRPKLLPRALSVAMLTADQGIAGRFAGVEGPFGDGSAPFLQARLRYQPNRAYLEIQTLPFDAPGICASANQCAVGMALERGLAGGDQDLRDMAGLLQAAGTRDGAREALASLSGEVHAGLSTLALGGAAQFGGMISQRLGALRSGQAEVGLGEAPLAYTSNVATSPAAAMLMRLPSQGRASNNAWARGYGFGGRLGGDANAGSASYRGGGMIGGFDRQITPSFLAGVSFGYASTDASFRRFSGKGSIDAHEGALYGSFTGGELRLDGLLGYGRLNLETERSIAFGALSQQAKAKYDGDRFTGALEAGYAVDLGWSTIEPLAALRYTFLRQGGFSETGAGGIGLTAPGQFASSLVGSVGLRLAREFELGAARFAIEARGRWQREFLDDAVAIDTAFIGASAASFSVSGVQIARDSALVGVGLSASAGRNVTLFADYDVRISSDVTAHAVTGGLRATW